MRARAAVAPIETPALRILPKLVEDEDNDSHEIDSAGGSGLPDLYAPYCVCPTGPCLGCGGTFE